ncbi:MAG TPA: helix-turn-helix domain-containing protein [Deltaproteobacteria bacterium]|jgi:PTS system nitrogen regulatory IIA component|nr:PTS sugar transporter subunit IIA [SAR324 cluster bacterium]HHZ79089.1 helix-turn-helix domain-containing protein [Candidatus Lambdaproteobacteria bacterium]HIN47366.1 helix-turn-helix domain-containing protein [Deltaproteobacteria bacterium]HIA57870.1 helix-turn-helix domain-containing protein [Candidatus Lambdaproteobacteria bacterium]HIB94872.1 helix-turn-helix domain-containing protein [Candidatus Lambdaproteobacteria bacterium]
MTKWLKVSDVVQLLHVPEATIYRWIRQGDIPCVVRRRKYYFNQSTLVSWAKSKHIHLEEHTRQAGKNNEQVSQSRLIEALKAGNVFQAVPSGSLESLFEEVAVRMALPQPTGDSLSDILLQREHLSSTGIGNGIAIPHSKTPLGKQISQSMVATFFLEKPMDFNAPDRLPVFVLFVLLSVDSFHHLLLLSQLARILSQPQMNDFLKNSPSSENLIEQFQKALAETA